MSKWYAAHLVIYFKRKNGKDGNTVVWENIVLVKADSEDEAFEKAMRLGKQEEGDDDGSLRFGDEPVQRVFAGILHLTLCVDPERQPGDGTEVSYNELEVDSETSVRKLLEGKSVKVKVRDPYGFVTMN